MLVPQEKIAETVSLAISEQNNPKRSFKQSVELIVTFKDLDIKKGELKLREIVVLPNPPSKPKKVLVVPSFEQTESTKKAEPEVILSKEELQKLAGQKRAVKKLASRNDWFLISQESMAIAGRVLGPALGPRGKFPTPLPNSSDVTEYVLRFKRSTIVKTKDQPQTQVFIGTEDQKPEALAQNAVAVLNAIEAKIKGPSNVRAIYIKTTMGKPVEIKLK